MYVVNVHVNMMKNSIQYMQIDRDKHVFIPMDCAYNVQTEKI